MTNATNVISTVTKKAEQKFLKLIKITEACCKTTKTEIKNEN